MPRTKKRVWRLFLFSFALTKAKAEARRSKGNGGHVVQLRLQCTRDYINKWPWFFFQVSIFLSFPFLSFLASSIHPSVPPSIRPVLSCTLGWSIRSVAKPLSSSDARSARSTAFVFMFAFIVITRFSSSSSTAAARSFLNGNRQTQKMRWGDVVNEDDDDDEGIGSGKIINHPLEQRTAQWKERINPILHPKCRARREIPLVCVPFYFIRPLFPPAFTAPLNSSSFCPPINIYQHGIHRRSSPSLHGRCI